MTVERSRFSTRVTELEQQLQQLLNTRQVCTNGFKEHTFQYILIFPISFIQNVEMMRVLLSKSKTSQGAVNAASALAMDAISLMPQKATPLMPQTVTPATLLVCLYFEMFGFFVLVFVNSL